MCIDAGAMRLQRVKHFNRQRIQLGRVVQPDLGQRPLDIKVNGAHSTNPIGPAAKSDVGMTVAVPATRTRPSEA